MPNKCKTFPKYIHAYLHLYDSVATLHKWSQSTISVWQAKVHTSAVAFHIVIGCLFTVVGLREEDLVLKSMRGFPWNYIHTMNVAQKIPLLNGTTTTKQIIRRAVFSSGFFVL